MEAKSLNNLSLQAYLDLEKETGNKYEYHDGYVFAMSGGTFNHGTICGNIFGELRSALRKKGDDCVAKTSEVKLHIEASNNYVYPDAMVLCGAIEMSEKYKEAVTNPTLIVEVLSESTSNYDLGKKFQLYRKISTLQEYVVIFQNEPIIHVYQKKKDIWKLTLCEGLDAQCYLESIDISIDMQEIYRDVNW